MTGRGCTVSRDGARSASLVLLFAVAGLFLALGLVLGGYQAVIAYLLGWVMAMWGLLGLFGVNVWAGGPLDKRLDPPDDEPGS